MNLATGCSSVTEVQQDTTISASPMADSDHSAPVPRTSASPPPGISSNGFTGVAADSVAGGSTTINAATDNVGTTQNILNEEKQPYDDGKGSDRDQETEVAWRDEKSDSSLTNDGRPADRGLTQGGAALGKDADSSNSDGESGFVAFGRKLGEMFSFFRPKEKPTGVKWRSASWFITLVVAVGVTMDVLAYVSMALVECSGVVVQLSERGSTWVSHSAYPPAADRTAE